MTKATVIPDRQAVIDTIHAAARQHTQAARRHQRRQTLGALLLIAGACAAFAALTPAVDKAIGVAGLVVLAALGILLVALRPGDQAEAHADTGRRLHRLLEAAPGLDTEALHAAWAAVRGDTVPAGAPRAGGFAVQRAENG